MPNRRDLKLDKYGIDKYRYRELLNFCYQYDSWQDIIKYKTHAVRSPQITGMPFGGEVGDPTEQLAAKRAEAGKNIQLIEQTMVETITMCKDGHGNKIYDGDWETKLYPHMIKAITTAGITYDYLYGLMDIPVSRNGFNNLRRYFFFLLDKNKS